MSSRLIVCSLSSLIASACGAGADPSIAASSPDAGVDDARDLCAVVPADVADLVLGGHAHDPYNAGTVAAGGTCQWRGAGLAYLQVSVHRARTRDSLDRLCAQATPPWRALELGVGAAACGLVSERGVGAYVLFEDGLFISYLGPGTAAQAAALVRAVADHVDHR